MLWKNIPKIQRFMWENKIWCVSKAVFLSKNRIWCNNTLPLFGLNMSFLCLKIHQYYSSIMQQIHYRLCTTKPWENSLNILANIQLNMERNLVKPVLNRLAYTIHVSKTWRHAQFFATDGQNTSLKREFDCATFSPACVGDIYLTL